MTKEKMNDIEKIVAELEKVKEYAFDKNHSNNEQGKYDSGEYAFIQDNVETFETAIIFIEQLIKHSGDLEDSALYAYLLNTFNTYYNGGSSEIDEYL